jgi:hypothetical protein
MKNVKLLTVAGNNLRGPLVQLWVDEVMVKEFDFETMDEAKAFKEGFRECESRFCRLDLV